MHWRRRGATHHLVPRPHHTGFAANALPGGTGKSRTIRTEGGVAAFPEPRDDHHVSKRRPTVKSEVRHVTLRCNNARKKLHAMRMFDAAGPGEPRNSTLSRPPGHRCAAPRTTASLHRILHAPARAAQAAKLAFPKAPAAPLHPQKKTPAEAGVRFAASYRQAQLCEPFSVMPEYAEYARTPM